MSNSIFRDIDSRNKVPSEVEDEQLKLEQNLVIVVNNKTGKVSVDERTLHSLLANETTRTSVSIVSVSSPTPSMHDEMDIEEQQKITLNEEQPLYEGELTKKRIFNNHQVISSVGITVENHYSSKEANMFVADVLKLAGIENPLTIDYEFQRYIVQNDHCYTNLTLPIKSKIVSTKKPETSNLKDRNTESEFLYIIQQVQKSPTKYLENNSVGYNKETDAIEKLVKMNRNEEETLESSESEYETENSDTSLEDNDKESDLDFEITRSKRSSKKGKKKRKILKNRVSMKNIAGRISKKRQSLRLLDIDEPGTSKDTSSKAQKFKNSVSEVRKVSKGKQLPSNIEETQLADKCDQSKINFESILISPLIQQSGSIYNENVSKLNKIEKADIMECIDLNSLLHPNILLESSSQNKVKHVKLPNVEEMSLIRNNVEKLENELPDTILFESLDEPLPEDILHTVAELAENKEIQAIIDEQVLGAKIDEQLCISEATRTSTPCNQNEAKTTESTQNLVKIIKSDGRVINLPPIEVPTTRGAKKRQQNDKILLSHNKNLFADNAENKIVSPSKLHLEKINSMLQLNDFKNKSGDLHKEKSTNNKNDSSIIEVKRKRKITNPAVLAILANEKTNDSESAESWNSEDDPDR